LASPRAAPRSTDSHTPLLRARARGAAAGRCGGSAPPLRRGLIAAAAADSDRGTTGQKYVPSRPSRRRPE
ncbi:hypothetical protein EMIHUDRAFT_454330, partial [Emiliania huxleyi CCMP1516]|uniref:Uncharacterized protein n=2 Tax=Emiliania huxleyi TaxID=2903 RepID=A0A0D3KWP7_EMIH1